MANDRSSGSLPRSVQPLIGRLRAGRSRLWRGAPNDASVPFTPPSSHADPADEHALREEVEEHVLRADFAAAQRAIGGRLAGGRHLDTALHLLGVVRLFQGDAASASDCLGQALELRRALAQNEREVSTRNALARVSMHADDHEGAWVQLDRALALEPFSLHLHWNRLCLARDEVARHDGRDERARARLDSAQLAMASIDPEWQDEAEANPFLLSLK